MLEFFDQTFFQGVLISTVFLFLSIWLSSRTSLRTTYEGKGIKLTIVLAYIMIWSGLYFLVTGAPNGGWDNPATGGGITLIFFGFVLKYLGQFLTWWHK